MLAYELGRPVEEIEAMGIKEFVEWLAFFKIVQTPKVNKARNPGG